MEINASPNSRASILGLIGWIVFSYSAALSAFFVSAEGWYAELQKPSWHPPAWVFGPVWTILYLMMGVAAWLVWRRGGWKANRVALTLFVVQWIFNAAWTPLFFGLHWAGVAFADIVLLWFTLLATIVAFARVDWKAAALMVPYLIWVSFASALNLAIWMLMSPLEY